MQAQEIIRYLKLLGEELEAIEAQQPIRLLLVGGAYMVTQIGNRAATSDVDVVSHIDRFSSEHKLLKSAADNVAEDEGIDRKWFSDNIGEFIEETYDIPLKELWLKHGLLEVYLPDPRYILMLKIIAARDNDIEDARALLLRLRIKNREQVERLLKKYGDRKLREDYAEEIAKSLNGLFG